ncbi:MAG: ferredoxin family protein [Candidatus Atribacteria bacterium]|nr:ferredoxin family protein [Candidatus Atribacteria bacterium]
MSSKSNLKNYENEKILITVNEEWCKTCGICLHFCPKKVLVANEKGYPEAKNIADCILCMLCELRCPDFAIKVEKKENIINQGRQNRNLED